jgi:hypothetical protein
VEAALRCSIAAPLHQGGDLLHLQQARQDVRCAALRCAALR